MNERKGIQRDENELFLEALLTYTISRLRYWSIEYVDVVIGRHESALQTKPVHDHSLEVIACFICTFEVDMLGTTRCVQVKKCRYRVFKI
jgi:hypothetical protein